MSPERSKEPRVDAANPLHMNGTLTPVEDADLRRLQALTRYATSAPMLLHRFEELRSRDRRLTVRDITATDLIRVVWEDDETK
jgi:hypothetical protein